MSQSTPNNCLEDGQNEQELAEEVFDIIASIQDPEKKPSTLGDLDVVKEELISVEQGTASESYIVKVEFTPTVPHCSLATLIGLCIRVKLERSLPYKFKLDIQLTSGTHETEEEVNKQINDKERVAAAMENPNLKKIVEECIQELD